MLTETKTTIADIPAINVTSRPIGKWTVDPVLGHPVLQWSYDSRSG